MEQMDNDLETWGYIRAKRSRVWVANLFLDLFGRSFESVLTYNHDLKTPSYLG